MIRVAIIDDHAVVRMGLKYAVMLAKDMELAFELEDGKGAAAAVVMEKPDVILLDIRMPDVDGLSALESILSVKSTARVIILSTSEAEEDIYRSVKLGAKGYVVKDRDSSEILNAIRIVAEGGEYFPEAVKETFRQRQQMPDLTPREVEVLGMVSKGLSNQEIGNRLGVGAETAKIHIKHIFDKMGVANRAECVAEAIRRGLMRV